MTEQAKASEQIMREALESFNRPFYKRDREKLKNAGFSPDFIAGTKAAHMEVYKDAHKALEEADKAESVSQQSERKLKRYFDFEVIAREAALQSFIESFKQEIIRSISISHKRSSGDFDDRMWPTGMRDALFIAFKIGKEEMKWQKKHTQKVD